MEDRIPGFVIDRGSIFTVSTCVTNMNIDPAAVYRRQSLDCETGVNPKRETVEIGTGYHSPQNACLLRCIVAR